jgi:hypothetical protein
LLVFSLFVSLSLISLISRLLIDNDDNCLLLLSLHLYPPTYLMHYLAFLISTTFSAWLSLYDCWSH